MRDLEGKTRKKFIYETGQPYIAALAIWLGLLVAPMVSVSHELQLKVKK
ncbi:MAG TPA: hypothetical protein VMW83_04435 [Spirochaetia bacterium]|nr:hypothetical protein [Spirochaetia bacterium]